MRSMVVAALLMAVACKSGSEDWPVAGGAQPPAPQPAAPAADKKWDNGVASRVFIVERETESLAIYDLIDRKLLSERVTGLGDMRHATMTFSSDLRYGYVATRNGLLSRIDLRSLDKKDVKVSDNSIDIAVSQDGRYIATAEYVPGGLTVLDARTMEVVDKLSSEAIAGKPSRVTGVVDAPGNRFVCVLIEGAEIWVVDASGDKMRVEHRIPTSTDQPYDAMITPDGRYYVVGHMGSEHVSLLDLRAPDQGIREISLRDPDTVTPKGTPVKLPHMASWAAAGDHVFVPLVGESRLAVLNRHTWNFEQSIPLRGHPVYSVASPSQAEVWVSFSGEENDAFIDIVDVESLKVVESVEAGGRIYHLDFTPRGSHVLVSANRANKFVVINAVTREVEDEETIQSPSGIFGAWRAFKVGL